MLNRVAVMHPTSEVMQPKCFVPGRVEMQAHERDTSRHEPTAAFILHQLGILAYNGKNIEAALRYMSMACAQPEAPALCHRNHAEILHRCGRLDKAEAAARLAIQRDPNCADAWDTLGTILFDRGALAECRDCYQAAVQIKPDFLPTLNNLAVVLHSLGQLDASEVCYRRALTLQTDSLEIQLNFANLLAELKRPREALKIVEQILRCRKNKKLYYAASELKRNLEQAICCQTRTGDILRVALKQRARKTRRAKAPCTPIA